MKAIAKKIGLVLAITVLVISTAPTVALVWAPDTKRTMAERAKVGIEKLRERVAASGVDPRFKRLADCYLEIALREMDKAIEYIVLDIYYTVLANCHLMRARLYVRRFSRLIDSFTITKEDPLLAEKWQEIAQLIVEDITTAINANGGGM